MRIIGILGLFTVAIATVASAQSVQNQTSAPVKDAKNNEGVGTSPQITEDKPDVFFVEKPIIRTSVGENEHYLEGEIAHTNVGILQTDATQRKIFGGHWIVLAKGSRVWGFISVSSNGIPVPVWCGFPLLDVGKYDNNCLAVGFTTYLPSFFVSGGFYTYASNQYSGGQVERTTGPLFPGRKLEVKYAIRSHGRITRFRNEAFVDGVKVNEWFSSWGSAFAASPEEKLMAISGGILGLRKDPNAKNRYLVREIVPLRAGGNAVPQELRNIPPKLLELLQRIGQLRAAPTPVP